MSEQERKLRQRIEWLMNALAGCREYRQRETLILRLLDTQDQLMTLTMLRPPAPRRVIAGDC